MAGKFEYRRPGEQRAYAEGRARQYGVGPANPHAVTSLKYAAFQAGLNFGGLRDSTIYGPGGWTASWTGVTFDGTNDYLTNATNLGIAATFDTFTVAVAFRATSLPGGGSQLVGHTSITPLALLQVESTGSITLNTPSDLATVGMLGASIAPAGTILAGNDYVVHVAARASTGTLQCWVNGVLMPAPIAAWLSTGAMPRPSAWSIGATSGGILKFAGLMGLAWFDVGQYIVDPAAFFPASDLGAQLANPGARPAIGFGGVQTAANWNAGTNLGDGTGTWTMTGAVT